MHSRALPAPFSDPRKRDILIEVKQRTFSKRFGNPRFFRIFLSFSLQMRASIGGIRIYRFTEVGGDGILGRRVFAKKSWPAMEASPRAT